MGKIGKSLFGKLIGNNNSCCCGGSSIVSVRKITIDDKDMDIAGLDEELKKCLAAGKRPEDLNGNELLQNILNINAIPESDVEQFKLAVLKEYRTYYLESKS
jgi:hypothetical protein